MEHVVVCRFLRLSCSEDEHPLFRREYARSNREKGVKLLRCFPHCCSEHVKQSYCGCSVHLLVTFSAEVRGVDLDEVLVTTRFEPSLVAPLWPASLAGLFRDAGAAGDDDSARHDNERKLDVGESVQLPASLLALSAGPSSNKGAVWVRAERESASMQGRFPKNTVLYAINKRKFPKWFYNYDSSTTRTQREMTHHLVAYVFQQNVSRHSAHQNQVHDSDPPTAVVLARHASPAFRLISFRRSGTTSNDSGCELPALDTPVVNEASRVSGISAQQHYQHQSQFNETTQQCAAPHQQNRFPAQQSDEQAAESYNIDDDLDIGHISAGGDDPGQWHGSREKGQHLLILWKFLKCISLHDMGISAATVGSYLLRVSAPRSESEQERVAISFLNGISDRPRGHHDRSPSPIAGSTSPATPSPAPEREIIRVAVCLFLRGLSSTTVKWILCTAIRMGSDMDSKERLREQFTFLVNRLYDALDDMLREYANDSSYGNQEAGVPALIDAILTLVYGQDRFESIRPEISALLDSQQSPELLTNALDDFFQTYTAQVREFMIASATQLHGIDLGRDTEALVDRSAVLHSGFSRRWTLNPQSVIILDAVSGRARDILQDFRVIDAAQFVYEAGCVDVELDTTTPRLFIQSAFSFANHATKTSMALLLDGRLRVFRVLPSGLSSMIATTGGWSIGDYAGSLSDDGQSLNMDLFAFAEGYHPHSGVEIAVK
ncbi:uncharacterized protein IUM83_18722 [Phytophthora cinnamomi]|uniref:uncharacterized protein n=1 Tax=Phytophthora cinnamomi TaxID=4785 RepID=UPI003559D377|nr:hypothetical protein IUM83_18722 [Phytophthora cinnamomi]